MGVMCSSETSVDFQPTTLREIGEDNTVRDFRSSPYAWYSLSNSDQNTNQYDYFFVSTITYLSYITYCPLHNTH
jgi:hypothetical protein